MSREVPSLHPRRSSVASEEQRAWLAFYRRVGHDVAIATEVLIQLEADAEMKRVHLALYLCCKESLRLHKARQARNRRIGYFVRGFAWAVVVRPFLALRRSWYRSTDLAVDCLPHVPKEPATAQVRSLTRGPELARTASEFIPQPPTSSDIPGARPARVRVSRKAA